MNTIGIDVSKDKSAITIRRPRTIILMLPFDILHTVLYQCSHYPNQKSWCRNKNRHGAYRQILWTSSSFSVWTKKLPWKSTSFLFLIKPIPEPTNSLTVLPLVMVARNRGFCLHLLACGLCTRQVSAVLYGTFPEMIQMLRL